MNETAIEQELRQAFDSTPVRRGGSSIEWRNQPALLWEIVEKALDEEEREEHSGLKDWPGRSASCSATSSTQSCPSIGTAWSRRAGWLASRCSKSVGVATCASGRDGLVRCHGGA